MVWRGLDAAAVTRFSQQVRQNPDQPDPNGFTETVLGRHPGAAARLVAELADAGGQGSAAGHRGGPAGRPHLRFGRSRRRRRAHTAAFPLGGKAKPKVTWKNRINLTLGYDSTDAQRPGPRRPRSAPGWRTPVGSASSSGPATLNADLTWSTARRGRRRRWPGCSPTWTRPLPGRRATVSSIENEFRATTDRATADRLLAQLQQQAASDLIVLPISQSDEHVYTRRGVEMSAPARSAPAGSSGFFGISNG